MQQRLEQRRVGWRQTPVALSAEETGSPRSARGMATNVTEMSHGSCRAVLMSVQQQPEAAAARAAPAVAAADVRRRVLFEAESDADALVRRRAMLL